MKREQKQRTISEQLMRVKYHRDRLSDTRVAIAQFEAIATDALDKLNKAKRELCKLGWKEPV